MRVELFGCRVQGVVYRVQGAGFKCEITHDRLRFGGSIAEGLGCRVKV